MLTILGAGGAIGDSLFQELSAREESIRLVSRNPQSHPGAETVSADLANPDDALRAVSGSRIAFLVAGLKYDINVWRDLWPRIMRNVIEACKRSQTKLVFFDNVYMYGKVDGPMSEETPFRPCSRKGEVRAEIVTALLNEIKAGSITALIARAPDFYGSNVRTAIPNVLVFDKFAKGERAMWPVNDSVKHSFTYTPDAAHSLVLLADSEHAWNQTWHVPTAPDPLTGKEFISLAANAFGTQPKYFVLPSPLMWLAGWFDSNIRELHEMLYQYESDYIFDSTKFTNAFPFQPTPYAEGIRAAKTP